MKKLALILLLIPTILKSQSALELEILKSLNKKRESLGLKSVSYSSNLSKASFHLADYCSRINKISHEEILNLPDFTEIETPMERVSLLTSYNIAIRKINDTLYRVDEVIHFHPGASTFSKNSNKISDEIIFDLTEKSEGHRQALLDPGFEGMEVGISHINGYTVIVYGYKK